MAQNNMREALEASLHGEQDALTERLAKADSFFGAREQAISQDPPPQRQPLNPPRDKVIRDGFTMPARDYKLITELQAACLQAGISVTKSEVLRAGLHALRKLSNAELKQLLMTLEKVKPGRPGR
jgi:hypothetical protein